MIMILLTAAGLFIVILIIPIGNTMRGQLLSLIGILLNAAIALSSTTVLGNAVAGVMTRAVPHGDPDRRPGAHDNPQSLPGDASGDHDSDIRYDCLDTRIPGLRRTVEKEPESLPEDVVFDKAEEAEFLENLRLAHASLLKEIEAKEDSVKKSTEGADRDKVEHEQSLLQVRKERLDKIISDRDSKVAEE